MDLFEQVKLMGSQDPIPFETEEAFKKSLIVDKSLVEVAIIDIVPIKREIELLGDVSADKDVRDLVPWIGGIAIKYVILSVMDGENKINLVEKDAEGKFIFPHGPTGLRDSFYISERELQEGWLRIYDDNKKQLKVRMPETFYKESPQNRFAFWWSIAGKMFGIAQLLPGTKFMAYLDIKKVQRAGNEKPSFFKKIKKELWDADTSMKYESPWGYEYIDPKIVNEIYNAIVQESIAIREKQDAFPPTGSMRPTVNPGF